MRFRSVYPSLGKSEANGGTAIDFALNPDGAAVKIDDRLYQSQAQACSIRSARWFCPVKSIEHPRQMFGSYSRAIVADRDLEMRSVLSKGDFN